MELDSARLRKLAWLGAARGPRWWLRYGPPPIGLLAALLSPRQRSHVRHNLRSLYGRRSFPVEAVDVARTFANFAQSLAESLCLRGTTDRQPKVRVSGGRHLDAAIASGKGVVLGTAHTAGWEVALWALGHAISVPVIIAMRPERDPQARRYHIVSDATTARYVGTVGEDPLSSIPLLQHLRRGGVVAMQLDRCPIGMRSRDVVAGHKTWTLPVGPFALASAAGAPIVMALTTRTGFLSYDLHVCAPIVVDRHANDWQTDSAERVARHLARQVYAVPTQWFDFAPT